MEDNYAKAYKEIVEILKYVPEESVNKIPKEMRDMFEAKQLKTYNFQIDIEKTFEEQEILEETKAILANIFRDYWATEYQRERILEKEKYDLKKLEIEKANRYNTDVFLVRNIKEKPQVTNNLPVKYKEKFYQKILDFFKSFFNI